MKCWKPLRAFGTNTQVINQKIGQSAGKLISVNSKCNFISLKLRKDIMSELTDFQYFKQNQLANVNFNTGQIDVYAKANITNKKVV